MLVLLNDSGIVKAKLGGGCEEYFCLDWKIDELELVRCWKWQGSKKP